MRFTIRELVLVTVIVAMALGWYVDRWRLINAYDRYIHAHNFKYMGEGSALWSPEAWEPATDNRP